MFSFFLLMFVIGLFADFLFRLVHRIRETTPNETELSHRWRGRASLGISVLNLSCANFLVGQRLAAALG
jgi:hypothetical protein